ncbi:MAG: barstar family protein [Ginsengibacter sp.]
MSAILNTDTNYYSENNIRFVFIDGHTCNRIGKCYDTLQQQLSLPDYFGRNLDALDEMLDDLEWVTEEKVKIIILNSDELLTDDLEKKTIFLDILNSSENEKLEIIYPGRRNE